jgi:predicted cupin superfamily sugar epimerase
VLGQRIVLGVDLAAGQRPQALVPGGVWQSAEPVGDRPVLVTCVVAPGFDFADFRMFPEEGRRVFGERSVTAQREE